MSEFREQMPESEREALLEEAISALKRVKPPLTTQIANRRAVAEALSERRVVNRPSGGPWWRRSVAVPVPLAIASGLLIAALCLASFQPWRRPATDVVVVPVTSETEKEVQPKALVLETKPPSSAAPKWKQYHAEVYLCGVGQVSSESYFGVKAE